MKLTYPRKDLSDSVVRLRRWSEADLNCIREASTGSRIAEATTVPATFTTQAGYAFIGEQLDRAESGEGLSLAIADAATNEALGLTVLGLRPQPAVVGIGYWVIPRARGRGLAAHAISLLSTWALRHASIARVEAWVEPENAASKRVLHAAGFKAEALPRSFPSFIVFSRTAQDIQVSECHTADRPGEKRAATIAATPRPMASAPRRRSLTQDGVRNTATSRKKDGHR